MGAGQGSYGSAIEIVEDLKRIVAVAQNVEDKAIRFSLERSILKDV
jgi:hypothetical protein